MPTQVGIVAAAQREVTALLVLRNADTAMYEAKGAGKSRVVMAHLVLGTSTSGPRGSSHRP